MIMENLVSLRRHLLVTVLLCLSVFGYAQKEKIVDISETNTLSTLLTADEQNTVTKLVITTSNGATLSVSDFNFIYMNMPKLEELDLSGDENTTLCGGLKVSNDFTNTTLKKLIFPPKTKNLGNFTGCGLTGVVEFPSTIATYKEIENKFLDCQHITGFAFPDGHPTMYTIKDGKALVAKDAGGDRLCLYLSSNTDKAYTIPENITALGLSAFGYNNYLEELTFSSALSDILRQNGNVRADVIAPQTPNLKTIYVPEDNVTFASTENGFLIDKVTSSLILLPPANKDENIIIDGSFVKKVGDRFFSNAPHIKTVVFGEGVEELGGSAFKQGNNGPMSLEFVLLPSTLKKIGAEAFALCSNLQQYICKAVTPPEINGNAVFRMANGADVRVGIPEEALNAYLQSAWLDSNYASFTSEGPTGNKNNGWSFQSNQLVPYKHITYHNAKSVQDVSAPGCNVGITVYDVPEGQAFAGWISTPQVTFENDRAATTTFIMPESDVEIRAVFGGTKPFTIIGAITQSGSAAVGAVVNIQASEAKGPSNAQQIFQEWKVIEGEGLVIQDPKAASTSFTMIDGPVTIEAIYKTRYYVNVNGGSAVTEAFGGDVITIKASGREKMRFVKWTSSTDGVVFADETAKKTTFVMPESEVDIEAEFIEDENSDEVSSSSLNGYPNDCHCGDLTDYQTSWIANSGGVPRTHVPHSMDALFVRGDGTVATICNWDEGGTNVGLFKDNVIVCVPEESGTGSWGRNSGKAVVLDDKYVYQLMRFNGNSGNDNLNSNGLRAYPPKGSGIEWQLITRYDAVTGKAARFPEGYGPLNNMLLVAPQESRYLQGLAITDDKLIVAVPGIPELQMPDSLKIYDKEKMSNTPIGGFRIPVGGVGYIYADKRGFVWMLQGGNKIVALDLRSGAVRFTVELPEGAKAQSFSIDTRSGKERLLVANRGKDLNVLIYTDIYKNPTLTSTFGEKGGILVKSADGKYLQGQVGPLRLPGPTGVGVDDNGNLYISNMFVNSASSILYSYKEATKELNWKQEGLVFTATGDFDQTQKDIVFCTEKVYRLDYSKEGGRMDTFLGTTVDPFTYPLDLRLEPNPPTPIKTGAYKRLINGVDYLFVSNMYSTALGGYRFDKEKYGLIGVPFMEVRADGLTFWQDTNADGQKTDNEVTKYAVAGNTFSIYPDKNGNIWLADRESRPTAKMRVWMTTGAKDGVLQYASPVTYTLPSYITDVNRVLYDPERDELFVACYTTKTPIPSTAIWGQVGTTILIYREFMAKKMDKIPSEDWKYDLELIIPASPATALPDVAISCKAMTFAGDYIFCFLTADGKINVYRRKDGSFVGQLGPSDVVQKRSGWTDFTYAINARENEDGTYEILAEENAFAKILHYDVRSFKGDIKMQGDLFPYRLMVQDPNGATIDPVNIPEGQKLKLAVRVKNIESGIVTNRRRTDPARCLVLFEVLDESGEVVYEAQSKIHEEDIYGGDNVLMAVDNANYPFWQYTKGKYTLRVDVNYGKKGKECHDDNNIGTMNFGGGDNTGEVVEPSEIETIESGNILRIYPNPVTSILNIEVDNTEGEYTLNITSIDGTNMLTQRIKDKTSLDLSGYPKGYYLVRVLTSNKNLTQKIVIK